MSSTATRSKSHRADSTAQLPDDVERIDVVALEASGLTGELAHPAMHSEPATPSEDVSDAQPPERAAMLNAEDLAHELERLIQSVATVEELSQKARQAAANDYEAYESVRQSAEQYRVGLEQASTIRDQVRDAYQRAFGAAAKSAAQPILVDSERVLSAFEQLSSVWEQRAAAFLDGHPDVRAWLAERHAREEEARRREAAAARARRLESLTAALDAALGTGVVSEAQRVLAVVQREFEGETTLLAELEQRLQRCARAERDEVARRALLEASAAQERGDLEAAVVAIEQIDVRGLSREVSKLVFGRWSDTCSRLAQTAGATLVRFAPAQGRGLILYEDPANANALLVFSSLGMGPGFPQGKPITDPWIIERTGPFLQAAPLAQSSWFGQPASLSAPAHH